MNTPAHFPRSNRGLFITALVCLLTIFATTIFVAASGDDSETTRDRAPAPPSVDSATKAKVAERFGRLPLRFESNEGQVDRAVKFLSHGPGYDLFLTANEAVLSLRKPRASEKNSLQPPAAGETREGFVLRLQMIGANAAAQVEGQEQLPGKVNYFAGNDPSQWRRDIPTYRRVYYKGIYPGIDVVYYGNQSELEYDFVVAPGADPKAIKFRVVGADRVRVDNTGDLLLAWKDGGVRLHKPVIYQLTENGGRSEGKGAYAISGNEVSFKVRNFDSRKPLVIDPVLSYSTFLGTNGQDFAQGIAVDSQGSAYVVGFTGSTDFPTTAGAFKTTSQSGGAFITKLDPTGSTLVYSSYLNGATGFSTTSATTIAVDAAGNAHVGGFTSAQDFPLVNPLKTASAFFKTIDGATGWNNLNSGMSGDVHTIAVAPNALQVLYAGTLNGPFRSSDGGATWTKLPTTGLPSNFLLVQSLAVSPNNSAVVYAGFSNGLFRSVDGGNTWSAVSLPIANLSILTIVFDPTTASTMYVGTGNGVFRSTDSATTWSPLNNFTGLVNAPNVHALAVDPATPATIYAGTFGSGLFKTTNGGANWSPINNGLGGNDNNFVNSIAIDPFNAATVYSAHGQGGLAIINKTTNGGGLWSPVTTGLPNNIMVTTLVADRSTPSTLYAATAGAGIFKTVNGGTNWTSANNGMLNLNVRTLVAHPTNSAILYAGTFIVGGQDAFVTKFNATGSGLLFSTLLGGNFSDTANGIAVDGAANIYVAGNTGSSNFPTVNANQSSVPGTCDNGFVTKINPAVPAFVFSTYLGGSSCDTVQALALDSAGDIYVTGQTSSTDFPTANAFQSTLGDTFNGDAFATKFGTNGSLAYSTYLGGNSLDSGRGIAVNASGEVSVVGNTRSANFPTLNPLNGFHNNGVEEAFVTKLNSQGSGLVYSTYLGGDSDDFARGVAVDAAGNTHVVGITNSRNFPVVPGALRTRSTLFKTIDNGTTWSNDNYGLDYGINSSINTIIAHPNEPSTLYAGTGSGVFKSTNGGRSWTAINNGLNDTRVIALVMDPSTPATLYAATQSFDTGNFGVYKTTDGGATWNLRKNGMGSNATIVCLAIDLVSPSTLYAALQTSNANGRVFRTTDGADNWTQVGTGVPSVGFNSLTVDPHNNATLYATALVSPAGIFRSVDSGATWNPVGAATAGPFGRFIAASPHTAGLLYAFLTSGVYKSVDGGDTWSKSTDKQGPIVFDPASASTVYLLSDFEGLLKSTDNGGTWAQVTKGYNGPVTSALAFEPLKPSTLYLATLPSGGNDSFVAKINPNGSALLYSTFLGGMLSTTDFTGVSAQALAVALDSSGNTYVAGVAQSPSFPTTPNSFQPLHRASDDAFITKLTMSHIISGQVLDAGAAPVSGAEVVLNDGTSISQVVTGSDGSYEFSHLPEGGSYTVSAAKAHFTMAPPSQTFNNLTSNQTLNFTATASATAFHVVSGQITNNGTGLVGVTVTLSGSQSGLRTTDANGNYSFELAAAGNYTLTPALLGFTFGPLNLTFNNLSAPQTANFTATRQPFVVTNTNNHGTGSLRETITNANATVGTDTITFNIPGPGVKTINLVNQLPDITDPVVIDAATQPGYAGTPLIEINGVGISSGRGLVIKAGGTTVRGLAIGNFSSGEAIFVLNCNNNVFQGNHLGVDAAGTTARSNSNGLSLSNSSNNLIGGTTSAARNVISGNTTNGITLFGSNNVVQGNYIGTDSTGNAAIGIGLNGIEISGQGAANNLIGGTTPGARNVITGMARGIFIVADATTIQGNLIGTDVTGTKSLQSGSGIVTFSATNTVVGGLTPAARNIISGNGGNGVFLSGAGSKLQGNYIGTDITGTVALGNSNTGVVAGNGALIGGTTPEARNIIAANGGAGNVSLGEINSGVAATVQGNYIGTDVTGSKALSPNTQNGIAIFTNGHLIGGTAAGAANVISGNLTGILVGATGPVSNVVIHGNLIGLNAQGTGPLPNTFQGVRLNGSTNDFVGGIQNGAGNKIAFNGGPGVLLFTGTGSSVRGNSIFGNGGLGIDIGPQSGVTANDPDDSDLGANNLQNFPVITTVSSNASNTTILGSLTSRPNTTYQIDFYSNAAVDPSGNGEGALFFNTTAVTTNANGLAAIDVSFPIALPSGRVITATATDPNGNTSEFSAADPTGATGSVQFSLSSFAVIEDVGTATITVQRTGGASGALSVQYQTTDGTATAGQDYTAASGTLNFANGETSKTIQIPITDDATTEPNETFTLELKNPSNLDSLGSPNRMTVTIQDKTTVPGLLAFNASVIEGGAGTTTNAQFEVRLSAATGRTVSVSYATGDLNANGGAACGTPGVDFENTSGTLTFQPGQFSLFVTVKVCGDKSAELNEAFAVNLSKGVNATLAAPQAIGTIINDDVIELLLEESGPLVNQATAFDSLFHVRDPFQIVSIPEGFEPGTDRNTRVMLFVRNLELNPGETPAAVIVRLIGSNNQQIEVPAEDFRAVPGTEFMQLTFRLPNILPAGITTIFVRAHGRISNLGTITIAP